MAQIIVNPATGANSPCDGAIRKSPGSVSFASIIAGSGNDAAYTSSGAMGNPVLTASTTTDQFTQLGRFCFNFDTSAIPDNAIITSAVFSVYINWKALGLTGDSWGVVSFTPASTASIANGDYANFGSTLLAPLIAAADLASAYNNFTLNASGIASINKAGITSLGFRSEWDRAGVFGGTWVSGANNTLNVNFADAGSNKPKLTIDYELPSGTKTRMLLGVG